MQNQLTRTRGQARRSSNQIAPCIEYLESRQLLSALMHPQLTQSPAAASPAGGYTPAQIRQAYGYDHTNRGQGQTIAIVDAYRDPNIAADLHTFDQQFGLADPNLTIVNQTGGSADAVPTDAGWSTEIALDVEWAHALAPKADILLVEANSAYASDLMAGVDFARHVPGVSVVSMSWGGSEFSTESQFDAIFTTPAGHQGVTFVTASGDSGSGYGPIYPASSPNVLAVGGTVLNLTPAGGYAYETGWTYSTGGGSPFEAEPAYQKPIQTSGGRTTPDVSFNASGLALYSSVPDQGFVGWSIVGGTSAGAPAWAALIAMANHTRAGLGKGSLDGASATLPALYSLYSPFGTTTYAVYSSAYHDITSGDSPPLFSAAPGYDLVTGLGSPKAVRIVSLLAGA